jgi:hypothetical protein
MTTVALPLAPKTTSPVPHLTSIHSTVIRGPYGDSRYPGNCSGHIIRDLLMFFRPRNVLDPMAGSGTCKDVCDELRIPCWSFDIKDKLDASDPATFNQVSGKFDFVWLHPPYWRMKKYSGDPRCLSNAKDMTEFYLRLRQVIRNCKDALSERGKIAILMGDYHDPKLRKMVPCVQMTKEAALREGLWPACTDIIRLQHGNSSSKKSYTSSFIPGIHDTCMVFERA